MRFIAGIATTVLSAILSAPALGVAVIEKNDRFEIDYSAQRVRYYGEAVVQQADGDAAMKAAERRARLEGLEYFASSSAKVLPFKAEGVKDNTTSFVTNYYGDGSVRVYLETSLTSVAPKDISFAQKGLADASAVPTSGIVFAVDKKAKPAAVYQVVDESGAVLFEARDMAEAAFRERLMGKWLERPGEKDLAAAVGAHPTRIALKAISPGKFQAARSEWEALIKEGRPHLVNGRVALVLP